MKTWEIALHEMRRLFGADYATDLLMDEAFDDEIIYNFDALGWNDETRRAEVWLPEMGLVPFAALGHTRRCPAVPDVFEVWYEYCRDYVEVPAETYWGIKTLVQMHDDACEVLQVLGWAADDEGPDEYDEFSDDSNSSDDHDETGDSSNGSDGYGDDGNNNDDSGDVDEDIGYSNCDECSDVSNCDDCSCSACEDNIDCDEDNGQNAVDPAVAAYRLARIEHGIGYAMQMAIEELPDAAHGYFTGFAWNNITQQPEVKMLYRDGSTLRVPVIHLGAVYVDPHTLRTVALRTTDNIELVVPDEQTARGMEYLLDLERAAQAAQNGIPICDLGSNSASPRDGAVSKDSASRSPGRASTTGSASPAAATSITESLDTAPAAASADTMDVDDPIDVSQPTPNANDVSILDFQTRAPQSFLKLSAKELPRTITAEYWVKVEPADNDAELLHGDDADTV